MASAHYTKQKISVEVNKGAMNCWWELPWSSTRGPSQTSGGSNGLLNSETLPFCCHGDTICFHCKCNRNRCLLHMGTLFQQTLVWVIREGRDKKHIWSFGLEDLLVSSLNTFMRSIKFWVTCVLWGFLGVWSEAVRWCYGQDQLSGQQSSGASSPSCWRTPTQEHQTSVTHFLQGKATLVSLLFTLLRKRVES